MKAIAICALIAWVIWMFMHAPVVPLIRRRLRIAWRFRVWPWQVPMEAVKYLSLHPLTERDIQRTRELAARFHWR